VSLKTIKSVEDLKGKKIATTKYHAVALALAVPALAVGPLSRRPQRDREDLVFTAEAPQAAAAFKAKQVDAAVTWSPT